MTNKVSEGIKYAQDVVAGNIVVCQDVYRACERFLRYYDDKEWDYEFCPKFPQHVLDFANLGKIAKGHKAGKPFILEPWQVFVICAIYGFRQKGNHIKRLVTDVIIFIPRKSGKTTLISVIGNYELLFGEAGSEVFCLATNREQAGEVFKAAKGFIGTLPPKVSNAYKVTQHEVQKRGDILSTFKALSRDTKKSGDGKNPSCAIVDEAAQITDRDAIEVLHDGMSARYNPLRIYITTSSYTKDTKFFEDYQQMRNILLGQASDQPHRFGLLYGIDEGDDWRNPATWPKANPMHGITIFEEAIARMVQDAQDKPAELNHVLCKVFNIWVSANSAWIDRRHWDDPQTFADSELIDTKPEAVFMGFDLGQTSDLNAVVRLDRHGPEDYFAHFKCFLPEDALDGVPTHYLPIYRQAIARGTLKLTQGNVRDDQAIMDYIRQQCAGREIVKIGYDNYNAANIVSTLTFDGLPMERVGQGMASLNNPSKEVEKLILSSKIKHLDDPFIAWQLGNCEVYVDVNNNIKVRKNESDKGAKVDAIIALIIAMYCSLDNAFTNSSSGFDFIEF